MITRVPLPKERTGFVQHLEGVQHRLTGVAGVQVLRDQLAEGREINGACREIQNGHKQNPTPKPQKLYSQMIPTKMP